MRSPPKRMSPTPSLGEASIFLSPTMRSTPAYPKSMTSPPGPASGARTLSPPQQSYGRRQQRVFDLDLDPKDRHQLSPELDHYLLLRNALGPTIAGGLAGVGKAGISGWSPSIDAAHRYGRIREGQTADELADSSESIKATAVPIGIGGKIIIDRVRNVNGKNT